MKNAEPLHLIIADPSQNVAEELVSELRNAGYATRAHHVASADELETALARQRWDLLVCRKAPETDYDAADLIARVRQSGTDFPVLLLEDGAEIERLTAGLALGATDVLLDGEGTIAYLPEEEIQLDPQGNPISHPLISVFFQHYGQGAYVQDVGA